MSAALVAVAGRLFATNFQYISPRSVFDFRLSLTIVLCPSSVGWNARRSGARGDALQLPADQAAGESDAARLVPLHLRRTAHRGDALRATGHHGSVGAALVQVASAADAGRSRRRAVPAVERFHPRRVLGEQALRRAPGARQRCRSRFNRRRSSVSSAPTARGRRRSSPAWWARSHPTSGSVRFRGEEISGLRNNRIVTRGLVRTQPDREAVPGHDGGGQRPGGGALRPAAAARGRRRASGWTRCSDGPQLVHRAQAKAGVLSIGELQAAGDRPGAAPPARRCSASTR